MATDPLGLPVVADLVLRGQLRTVGAAAEPLRPDQPTPPLTVSTGRAHAAVRLEAVHRADALLVLVIRASWAMTKLAKTG
eukprot:1954886-Alexandrium_andersonii.AAC.1